MAFTDEIGKIDFWRILETHDPAEYRRVKGPHVAVLNSETDDLLPHSGDPEGRLFSNPAGSPPPTA